MHNRLFVLQIAVVHEQLWFRPKTEEVVRSEREYAVEQFLFAAADEDSAFAIAEGWLKHDAFSDAHHDGRGDRTSIRGLGIHQLEEIDSLSDFPREVNEDYGIHLPLIDLCAVDSDGVPVLRSKDELEVFRLLRLHRREGA